MHKGTILDDHNNQSPLSVLVLCGEGVQFFAKETQTLSSQNPRAAGTGAAPWPWSLTNCQVPTSRF